MRIIFLIIILLCFNEFAISQAFDKFKEGRYYDLKGKKHEGFVYYDYYSFKIKFKENPDSKNLKLKPWKVKAFVLEEDSFSILKDFYYEGPNGSRHKEIMDFVEVLETGHICLYKHYTNIQSSPNAMGPNGIPASTGKINSWDLVNYLLTSKGSSNILLVRKKNPKKFKEQMVIYFQSYPTFLSKIEATEFSWETLPSLIAEFNQFKENSP